MPLSRPVQISRKLADSVDSQTFGLPVTHVYNPLRYARLSHEKYLRSYAHRGIEVLLVGMNPGPWGMAQTGVPFGEISAVRDWMGISATTERPSQEHPKRPIQGFACERSEVSGRRLWGWVQDRFGEPEAFFSRFFVHNYCPLVFMEESGRNFTPDKLPKTEQAPLFATCDVALVALVAHLEPRYVLGVGAFAERQIKAALPRYSGTIGRILHPSPASPAANRGWAEAAELDLKRLGIAL
ncbi:MAG: single-stranded DNA-binding protein [Candidatus Hydrogenedentes bacterium]|nr:single-stranded DNA-binding protein [Candidatus Hydrogenedentota bacterium]